MNDHHGLDGVGAIFSQPGLNRVGIDAMAPITRDEIDDDAELFRHRLPQCCELPGLEHQHAIAGRERERALEVALGTVRVAATTEVDKRYARIPHQAELSLDPAAAYVHMTSNNTLFGTQWHWLPEVGKVPLIADMSSDFMWRKIDVGKFDMIYAGAQKNIGPSGVVVVIAKKDFIAGGRKDLPTIFQYRVAAENNSLYNTPPTFGIYLIRNVLSWVKKEGGLDEMERRNREKGRLLYGVIDAHAGFYSCPVEPKSRSLMNIVFRLPSEELEDKLIAEAKKHKMVGLKGHRSVGGIRVSAYNAVTVDWMKQLTDFMSAFAKTNG